jgi:hypothetical protein
MDNQAPQEPTGSPLDDMDITTLRDVALKAAAEAIRLNDNGEDPDQLDHLLNLIVQSLLIIGQRMLTDVDQLSKQDRSVIYDEWNRKIAEFVRHIRMPHDFDSVLTDATAPTLWDWAVIAAQSFAGTNPIIEKEPEYAEDRRVEAFDLMMRILARMLNLQKAQNT